MTYLFRDYGSLVGLCIEDYKSPCVAVTICATLVNIHTETQRDNI